VSTTEITKSDRLKIFDAIRGSKPEEAALLSEDEKKNETESALPSSEEELRRLQAECEYYEEWRDKVAAVMKEIEEAMSERTRWGGILKDCKGELNCLLTKGPETMHNRPLLDEIEKEEKGKEEKVDSEDWRETPISELNASLKTVRDASVHFQNAGQLVDWLNGILRDKKKGLGKKAVEELESAVNALHEPLIQSQLTEQKTESAENGEAEPLTYELSVEEEDEWTWVDDGEESEESDDESA